MMTAAAKSGAPRRRDLRLKAAFSTLLRRVPWLFPFLVAEFAMFLLIYQGQVASLPPLGEAQSTLLRRIYQFSSEAQMAGFVEALRNAWAFFDRTTPFTILGGLLDVYAGGGRLALLMPNIVLYIGLQVGVAVAAWRCSKRPALVALALALLLTQNRPRLPDTGLFAVNPDFVAFCAFGIVITFLVGARMRTSAGLLGCAGFTLLALCADARVGGCCLLACGCRLLCDLIASGWRSRIFGLALLLLLAAILWFLITPDCTLDAAGLANLPSAVAKHCRMHLGSSLNAAISFDLGLAFALVALGLLGTLVVSVFVARRIHARVVRRVSALAIQDVMFLSILLVLLFATQIIRPAVDPLGFGLFNIPLTLLLASLPLLAEPWLDLALEPAAHKGKVQVACFVALAFATAVAWGGFASAFAGPPLAVRAGYATVMDWLVRDVEVDQRDNVRILFVPPRPELAADSLTAYSYERYGVLTRFYPLSRDDMKPNSDADYLVFGGVGGEGGSVSDTALDTLRHEMVERVRVPVDDAMVVGLSRPRLLLSGTSGGWLTAEGTELLVDPREIKEYTTAVLRGPDTFAQYLPGEIHVNAMAELGGDKALPLRARIERASGSYAMFVDLAPLRDPSKSRAKVRLSFDKYFVPKELGMNTDPRRLTIPAPTSVRWTRDAVF